MLPEINLKMKTRQWLGAAALLLAGSSAWAQGPGNAMNFAGTASFERVKLDTTLSQALSTTDFTIEMWLNPDMAGSGFDPAFIGNKDWNNGANTGFAWVLYSANSIRFNFKPANGTRRDYNMTIPKLQGYWNHIAITVNRKGNITAYLNGVQTGTPINIAADSNKVVHGTLPIHLGSDGTGTYNYNGSVRFDGKLDEVRIWNTVRTATEIRDNMCRKLPATNTSLLAYYKMDETNGNTVLNSANGGTVYNGTIENGANRIPSTAPLGDTSVNAYPVSWTGQTLELNTANRGKLRMDSAVGNGKYVHLFRIDGVPANTTGINARGNNNVHFGVFTNDTLAVYPSVVYSNYDSAKYYKKNIQLFQRDIISGGSWTLKPMLANDTTNFVIRLDSLNNSRQLMLGNMIGSCNTPSAQGATGMTYNSAILNWTSGGAAIWNLQYGAPGFTPGTGTFKKGITTNPYTLTGLTPNSAYAYYVQDSCAGIGSSSWTGPYTFTTAPVPPCNTPGTLQTTATGQDYGEISWVTGGSNRWNIQYGVTGFTPGTGTSVKNVTANNYYIGGLLPSTAYQVYVQDTCNGLNASAWAGPLSFTTTAAPTLTGMKGPGYAINFAGTSLNEHLLMDSNILKQIDTTSFTVEFWMKMDAATASDASIISNKDWGSGTNTGFVICRSGTNTIKVNAAFGGGSRFDLNSIAVPNMQSRWNHIAIVFDRQAATPQVRAIINGVQTASGNLTPAQIPTGTLISGLQLRLGQDGTGVYSEKFGGQIEELRIWKKAISLNQVRADMTRKLSGTENSLVAYLQMNEVNDTLARNKVNNTIAGLLRNTTAAQSWVASTAPVGDKSVQAYGNYANGLQLPGALVGQATLSNITGFTGVQLYRADTAPMTQMGALALKDSMGYFGVFTTGTGSYNMNYSYSNLPNVAALSSALRLFAREQGSNFTLSSTAHNTTTHQFDSTTTLAQEWAIGNFPVSNCTTTGAATLVSKTAQSINIQWTANGGTAFDVEYGLQGFTPGTGTLLSNLNATQAAATGLTPGTAYSFYTRKKCNLSTNSTWSGPAIFTTDADQSSKGAGYAINLDGSNDFVNVPALSTDSMRRMTVTAWVKANGLQKSYAGIMFYSSTGGLNVRDNNELGYHWSGAAAYNFSSGLYVPQNEWAHVAIVMDTNYAILYLNGVPSDTNKISHPARLLNAAWYVGKGASTATNREFKGQIDEVRVFNRTLSTEEIRTQMCRKNIAADTSLLVNLSFNELPGTLTATDKSGRGKNGTLTNMTGQTDRLVSGAALGDTSVYLYPAQWNNQKVQLTEAAKGKVTATPEDSTIRGMQVYLNRQVPNFTNGTNDAGPSPVVFGAFPAGNYKGRYELQYDYSNNPVAVTNAANIRVYNRKNNAGQTWAQLDAVKDLVAKTITRDTTIGTREVVIGSYSAALCMAPDNLQASNVDTSSAMLTWNGHSGYTNLQYGPAGFELGNGMMMNNLNVNSESLYNLPMATAYEFYVQDSCSNNSKSAWTGPVYFETKNACVEQTNLHADSIRMSSAIIKWTDPAYAPKYSLSWGPKGFGDPTFGILETSSKPRIALNGLIKNTEYDVYLRSNCPSFSSKWTGPYTFRTDTADAPVNTGIANVQHHSGIRMYPNPAQTEVVLESLNGQSLSQVRILNQTGITILNKTLNGQDKQVMLDVRLLLPGMYFIECTTSQQTAVLKLMIQR
jgi:hypothetical protein